MLTDVVTAIANSIRGAELCETPYPVEMSTSVCCQGLRSHRRILYGIRLQCYTLDHI